MAGNPQGVNVNNAMQSDGAGGYSITPQEPSFGGNSNPLGMGMQPTGNARPPGAPQAPVYNNPAPPMPPAPAPTMLPDRGPPGPGGYARPGFGQPDYSAMPPDQRPEQRGFGGFPGPFGGNPFGGGGSPFDMFARMRGMGGGAPDVSNVRDSIDTDNRMMGNPQQMQQRVQEMQRRMQQQMAQGQMGGLGGINPYKRPQD